MSNVKIKGNASGTGSLTIEAPNTNTDRTLTLPDSTGTLVHSDASGNVVVNGTLTTGGKTTIQGAVKVPDSRDHIGGMREYLSGSLANGESVSWNGSGTTHTQGKLNLNGIGGNAGAFMLTLSVAATDTNPGGALVKFGIHGQGFNTFNTIVNQFDTGITVTDGAQISISNSSGETIHYMMNVFNLASASTTVNGW